MCLLSIGGGMTLLFLLTCSLKRKNERSFLTTRDERTIWSPFLSTSLVYYTNAIGVTWCQYFCGDVILMQKTLAHIHHGERGFSKFPVVCKDCLSALGLLIKMFKVSKWLCALSEILLWGTFHSQPRDSIIVTTQLELLSYEPNDFFS